MPTALQFRRGTTAQNNSFTGALGEISIDTQLDTIRVHDGSTAGGFELVQKAATQTLTNKTVALGSNTVSGTTAQFNTALSDGSFATLAGSETLTNKTINASQLVDASVLSAKIAGDAITGAKIADDAIDSEHITDGSVDNVHLAGSIANDKLANSSINFGGVSLALGASDTTPAFDLADATNYPTSSLTGTITNAQLAGSIANAKLVNSSITVSDGSNSTATALGGTITFSGTANEVEVGESSGTITVGLPDDVTIGNDLTVAGDLTVQGTTTTLATTNSTITDRLIELGNGTTGTPSNDMGIVMERGDSNNAFMGFDESTDKFTVGTGTFTGTSTGNLSITTGTLVANIEGAVTGNVTGNLTGNVTGNVTGDITGDVTGNVTGNLTGDVTATNVKVTNIKANDGTASFAIANSTGAVTFSGTVTGPTTATLVVKNSSGTALTTIRGV